MSKPSTISIGLIGYLSYKKKSENGRAGNV